MWLHAVLWLTMLVARVAADDLATRYQMVFLWYTYQMDLESNFGYIVPKCTTCDDLDGFLRQIQMPSQKPWTGSTGLTGHELSKSISEIADAIQASGYSGVTKSTLIMPKALKTPLVDSFTGTYGPVMEVVDGIRAQAGSATNANIQTYLERAKESMNQALAFRRQKQAANVAKNLQSLIKSRGWSMTVQVAADGSIDAAATLATNKDPTDKMSKLVKDYVSGNWPAGLPNDMKKLQKADVSHATAITAAQEYLSRLESSTC